MKKRTAKETDSEFGKGFIYNLILFAKHWAHMRDEIERVKENVPKLRKDWGYDIWFNGASDHFYELEIPEQWKRKEIGKLAAELQSNSLHLGHHFPIIHATEKDFVETFEKLEKLAMLIDKELGLDPVKAMWS